MLTGAGTPRGRTVTGAQGARHGGGAMGLWLKRLVGKP